MHPPINPPSHPSTRQLTPYVLPTEYSAQCAPHDAARSNLPRMPAARHTRIHTQWSRVHSVHTIICRTCLKTSHSSNSGKSHEKSPTFLPSTIAIPRRCRCRVSAWGVERHLQSLELCKLCRDGLTPLRRCAGHLRPSFRELS